MRRMPMIGAQLPVQRFVGEIVPKHAGRRSEVSVQAPGPSSATLYAAHRQQDPPDLQEYGFVVAVRLAWAGLGITLHRSSRARGGHLLASGLVRLERRRSSAWACVLVRWDARAWPVRAPP